jgi:ketosteroid isomerase-like protein
LYDGRRGSFEENAVRFGSKFFFLFLSALWLAAAAQAQLPLPGASTSATPNPLLDTSVNTGKLFLFDLEAKFAKDVAARGGQAFADWFADDGVALGNGEKPSIGKSAIAMSASWSPTDYQLTWTPTEAVLGPSGDIGWTWGHYEGKSKDANGFAVSSSGRYITIWRKQPNGQWKVALDAGANDAVENDCCSVKK